MFVILGDVLELFVADGAVEGAEGSADFGLERGAAGDGVLYEFHELGGPSLDVGRAMAIRDGKTYFTSETLFFCFFDLSFGVEFSALRYGRLYHADILARLSQSSQIILDVERDRVNTSYRAREQIISLQAFQHRE